VNRKARLNLNIDDDLKEQTLNVLTQIGLDFTTLCQSHIMYTTYRRGGRLCPTVFGAIFMFVFMFASNQFSHPIRRF